MEGQGAGGVWTDDIKDWSGRSVAECVGLAYMINSSGETWCITWSLADPQT